MPATSNLSEIPDLDKLEVLWGPVYGPSVVLTPSSPLPNSKMSKNFQKWYYIIRNFLVLHFGEDFMKI